MKYKRLEGGLKIPSIYTTYALGKVQSILISYLHYFWVHEYVFNYKSTILYENKYIFSYRHLYKLFWA